MQVLIEILHDGNHSCVIRNHSIIRTFDQKGIRDLLMLLNSEPEFLHGADVADKVVGKAAASIIIVGGVKRIYTDLISEGAKAILEENGIEVSYSTIVPYIKKADLSAMCPMEALTLNAATAEEAVTRIKNKISQNK